MLIYAFSVVVVISDFVVGRHVAIGGGGWGRSFSFGFFGENVVSASILYST